MRSEEPPLFTLELARAHIHDLHRAAALSHRTTDPRVRTRLRRLVGRPGNR